MKPRESRLARRPDPFGSASLSLALKESGFLCSLWTGIAAHLPDQVIGKREQMAPVVLDDDPVAAFHPLVDRCQHLVADGLALPDLDSECIPESAGKLPVLQCTLMSAIRGVEVRVDA